METSISARMVALKKEARELGKVTKGKDTAKFIRRVEEMGDLTLADKHGLYERIWATRVVVERRPSKPENEGRLSFSMYHDLVTNYPSKLTIYFDGSVNAEERIIAAYSEEEEEWPLQFVG